MQRTLVGLDSIIVSRGPTAPHSLEVLWYPKQHPSFHEITDDMQTAELSPGPSSGMRVARFPVPFARFRSSRQREQQRDREQNHSAPGATLFRIQNIRISSLTLS